MSAEQLWQLALYHPELGYYHNGLNKFGAGGDFVTAPELGDGFAFCLAHWCQHILEALDGPRILELGAGSGALAASLLLALEQRNSLPQEYAILEVSGALKVRQRETLAARAPHLLSRVRWLERTPQEPWQGLMIGNEVVDALPPRRLIFHSGLWHELKVIEDQTSPDALTWQTGPPVQADLPDDARQTGYTTEDQPMLKPWVQTVTQALSRGALALVDYGYTRHEYYHRQRGAGTAIAHYRHRAHDNLLWMPGLQDLSVSVDFSALAQAITEAGLTLTGYTSQAQFLLQHGLTDYAGDLTQDLSSDGLRRIQEIKYLTLPSEMGERFSVMIGARDMDLPAMAIDQRHRL